MQSQRGPCGESERGPRRLLGQYCAPEGLSSKMAFCDEAENKKRGHPWTGSARCGLNTKAALFVVHCSLFTSLWSKPSY